MRYVHCASTVHGRIDSGALPGFDWGELVSEKGFSALATWLVLNEATAAVTVTVTVATTATTATTATATGIGPFWATQKKVIQGEQLLLGDIWLTTNPGLPLVVLRAVIRGRHYKEVAIVSSAFLRGVTFEAR